MSKYVLLVIIVVTVFVLWTFMKTPGVEGGTKISPEDAKKRLGNGKGSILLDVRTNEEYLERHIPGSTLIPLDVLSKEASKKLPDKNAQIIVYCRSGNRSATAVKALQEMGYTNLYDLGGITTWPYETVSGIN